MLPIPSFLAPAAVSARALNALLKREEWARERLGRHAGKTVKLVAGRASVGFTLQSEGYVEVANVSIVPDVTLTIPSGKLGELPGALRDNDPNAITALMHVQGDAGLAQVVSGLARDLRWDVEDDLAAVVGDMAAVRVLNGVKSVAAGARVSAQRLTGNVGEYLAEESRLVLGRSAYQEWKDRLATVNKRLDGLEGRIARLARRFPTGSVPRA